MLVVGLRGFYRAYLRIRRGRPDSDLRFDHWPSRLWYALTTTLSQRRTFRKRGWVNVFHSFIFYGFVFYLLVNLVDLVAGYDDHYVSLLPPNRFTLFAICTYAFLADVLSFLVLLGVVALVLRRFLLPARTDFSFNDRTLLHKDVRSGYINRDSLIVSVFILFHVGSRAIGAGAAVAAMPRPDLSGPAVWNPVLPFSSLLAYLFIPAHAHAWQVFGYWGALGSVLGFLAYFPYSKHIHLFAAPAKYFFARRVGSGVLPILDIQLDEDEPVAGAAKLEELTWPRLLDAYACIQCNRCQDVCPATATGKSLSPAALEINKRMELNHLSSTTAFERGGASTHPLLAFALIPEAAWACTTCGACMEVCPVQDEQMLDIIDVRRHQVMIEGEFPAQLQTAFRGMERAKNPWGISHDKRPDWAEGLKVKTIEDNPTPEVLYWVGCAASYDPQAQKTARAVVQLLDHAGVDFAVLGKRECCTGDSARRGGNELLYRQLADDNVATLNAVRPKLVVASCPHCMNALDNEYKQIGGDYTVMHHSEYLDGLVKSGKLRPQKATQTITYHDPCYLGRHNGVYDAPRNLLRVLGNEFVEMERSRANSFCCGAGGAQFWKEEEAGTERVSENRFKEAQRVLAGSSGEKTLAVGCPFCKSMLGSTPSQGPADAIVIKDVAELLLEGVQRQKGISLRPASQGQVTPTPPVAVEVARIPVVQSASADLLKALPEAEAVPKTAQTPERKKWQPKTSAAAQRPAVHAVGEATPQATEQPTPQPMPQATPPIAETTTKTAGQAPAAPPPPERKKWQPKGKA